VRLSIRYRLFIPLLVLLAGIGGISAWSAVRAARQAEARIATQVRGVTHALAGSSISLTPRILEQMKGLSGADYLLIDSDERQLSTLPTASIDLPASLTTQAAAEDSNNLLGTPLEIDGRHFRGRRIPQRAGGNLYVLYPEALLDEAMREAAWPALVFGLGGGIAGVIVMSFLGQRLVGRIRELDRRTRQIASGDFSPMPLPRSHDELLDLSKSVNEMANRLAQLQEAVKATERYRLLGQLSSGLAHQLRNSVTGARLAIQLHESEQPDADREALDVALRQLDLMEVNLRRFMELGHTEPGPRKPCDLGNIINDLLSLHAPQARHAGIRIDWQPPDPAVVVSGNADLLPDLVQNLLSNAMEAVGRGGEIWIALARFPDTRQISLTVADSGMGPAADIADRIFDPFVTGKPEGIGLGLAVVRHAVNAHGGTIYWKREADRTVFEVTLPSV